MVRVDLNVLVGGGLFGEDDPGPLHKGAKPAAVEPEGVVLGVAGGEEGGGAGRVGLEARVD